MLIHSKRAKVELLKILAFILFITPLEQANASNQAGKIVYLTIRASDGLIYFELDSPRGTRPTCATYNYFMLKSESSNTGKQQYAMLLSAKIAGKTIEVSGSHQCDRWHDGEDVEAIRVID